MTRTLSSPPNTLLAYGRAALPLLPGASRLPWIPGSGSTLPAIELALERVEVDAAHLRRYRDLCGFSPQDGGVLPLPYPHLLAFGLHLALMTDGAFPFAPIGLVHLANEITARREIASDEHLAISARASDLQPHPRGRTFALRTIVSASGEPVWEETSTMLRRGAGTAGTPAKPATGGRYATRADWDLDAGLGRRYAALSGDRNPIHLHDLSARLFGFRRAIAHGMWTLSRCVAELDAREHVVVRFRRPVELPARVSLRTRGTRFEVRGEQLHLEGEL